MNDQTIQMIAQAIIANTKVIQSLIDALPHETKEKVASVVAPVAPAQVPNVAPAQVPNVAPAPTPTAPVTVTPAPVAPVAPAPVTVSPSSVMPPPPVFTAAPATTKAPFNSTKSLIDYIMGVYKQLGPQKGAGIQDALNSVGSPNINDVTPDKYDALYALVEAMKA